MMMLINNETRERTRGDEFIPQTAAGAILLSLHLWNNADSYEICALPRTLVIH